MTTRRAKIRYLFLLPAIFLATEAFAEFVACGGSAGGQGSCPPGGYLLTTEPPSNDAGACSLECMSPLATPPTPTMRCLSEGMEHTCEVWPRSSHFTYTWRHSGEVQLTIPSPTPLFHQHITCARGATSATIGLSVVSSWGLRSDGVFTVYCDEINLNENPHPVLPSPPVEPTH